jgi:hypothetical protein
MGRVADLRFVSPEAYLEWESRQQEKPGSFHGPVYTVGAASQTHVVATGNLVLCLSHHLRGSRCRVYLPDMKLRVAEVDA